MRVLALNCLALVLFLLPDRGRSLENLNSSTSYSPGNSIRIVGTGIGTWQELALSRPPKHDRYSDSKNVVSNSVHSYQHIAASVVLFTTLCNILF